MRRAATIEARTAFDPLRRAVEAADRFAAVAEGLDASSLDRPVPTCGRWTVRDLVAHVSTVGGWYVDVIDGVGHFASTPREIDVINATNLEKVRERPVAELANSVRQGARLLAERLGTMRSDELVSYHAGSALRPEEIMTMFHCDVLVHGYDLARAASTPWTIPTDEAVAAFDAMMPLSPRWVDHDAAAGHNANYEIRLRGGPAYFVSFSDGEPTTNVEPGERIDCHIAGDPATLLLVMVRRISTIRAAATGKSIAWGRRPWLAFSFTGRFQPL